MIVAAAAAVQNLLDDHHPNRPVTITILPIPAFFPQEGDGKWEGRKEMESMKVVKEGGNNSLIFH